MSNRYIIQAEPREGVVVLTVHDPNVGEHGKERRFIVTADALWEGKAQEELGSVQVDRLQGVDELDG